MWQIIKKLGCTAYGHEWWTPEHIVYCDAINPDKVYCYRNCRRCGIEEYDYCQLREADTVTLGIVAMSLEQWGDLRHKQLLRDKKLSKKLHRKFNGISGKYRSIDEDWDQG